jgi:hypothetical protein
VLYLGNKRDDNIVSSSEEAVEAYGAPTKDPRHAETNMAGSVNEIRIVLLLCSTWHKRKQLALQSKDCNAVIFTINPHPRSFIDFSLFSSSARMSLSLLFLYIVNCNSL